MKRILMGLIVLASLCLVCGCGGGIADDGRERQERWNRIFANDAKQFNDDVDAVLLMDQPGRLSWWRVE
jgi:hypothetical protein